MPSTVHQWLVLWAARKMSADGFVIGGYEGPTPQGGVWNALPITFEIRAVRPDVWGVNPESGQLAVGEAKTLDDVLSSHTREQLRVFMNLRERASRRRCKLYLAVPHSAAGALDRALIRAGCTEVEHVVRIHIPDCLLPEALSEHA